MTYHAHNMDTPKMKKTQYTGLEKGELDWLCDIGESDSSS
jgi:hypothetical protein